VSPQLGAETLTSGRGLVAASGQANASPTVRICIWMMRECFGCTQRMVERGPAV